MSTALTEATNKDAQVLSKQRVSDHGEVFTAQREVNAMLDLVKSETERIDSRFLEPACGTGNFLVAILNRKLTVVAARYDKNLLEWERYAWIALSSLYGVDILQDNVQTCRDRLLELFTQYYNVQSQNERKPEFLKSAAFVLSKNIIWGDALTLRTPDPAAKPIIFAEWSAVQGSFVKRRDYTMEHLLQSQPVDGNNLFSDLGDKAFLPVPVADFPLTHFLQLSDTEHDFTQL